MACGLGGVYTRIAIGSVVTLISGFLGGIDGIMIALLAFISADYISGVLAAIHEKNLSSEIGFWGLVRKVCILTLIGISHEIDVNVMHSSDVFRTAVALYYIGNEGISLLENIGTMGVKLPPKLVNILQQLSKGDKNQNKKEDNHDDDNSETPDSK